MLGCVAPVPTPIQGVVACAIYCVIIAQFYQRSVVYSFPPSGDKFFGGLDKSSVQKTPHKVLGLNLFKNLYILFRRNAEYTQVVANDKKGQ